jgi:hypothetical protein
MKTGIGEGHGTPSIQREIIPDYRLCGERAAVGRTAAEGTSASAGHRRGFRDAQLIPTDYLEINAGRVAPPIWQCLQQRGVHQRRQGQTRLTGRRSRHKTDRPGHREATSYCLKTECACVGDVLFSFVSGSADLSQARPALLFEDYEDMKRKALTSPRARGAENRGEVINSYELRVTGFELRGCMMVLWSEGLTASIMIRNGKVKRGRFFNSKLETRN